MSKEETVAKIIRFLGDTFQTSMRLYHEYQPYRAVISEPEFEYMLVKYLTDQVTVPPAGFGWEIHQIKMTPSNFLSVIWMREVEEIDEEGDLDPKLN